MKKFNERANEIIVEGVISDYKKKLDNNYKEFSKEVLDFVDDDIKSLFDKKTLDGEKVESFIKKIIKDKDGLTFFQDNEKLKTLYYKYQNDIDSICKDEKIKFDDFEYASLDDLIPYGVKYAVIKVLKTI